MEVEDERDSVRANGRKGFLLSGDKNKGARGNGSPGLIFFPPAGGRASLFLPTNRRKAPGLVASSSEEMVLWFCN